MRKKIHVTTEESLGADGATSQAPGASEPEYDDHVRSGEAAGAPSGAAAPDATQAESADSGLSSDEPTPGDDGESAYIVALQAELAEAQHKFEDAEKRLVYLQAEFQNFRRRKEEENRDLQKFGNSELIRELLPVVDNFERALSAADRTKNFDALVAGVSGTLKQLQTFLQKAGVKPIEAVGKEFDPNFHEAIGHAEADDLPANTVAEEVQRGYTMHDRVLRPTLVKVSGG